MNKNTHFRLVPILIAFLLGLYAVTFYLMFSHQRMVDFIPFYVSSKLLIAGQNPYPMNLPISLNPPFSLFLFYPLGLIGFHLGMLICSLLYLILGLIAVGLAFFYVFSDEFRKKYQLILYLFYFSFFPVLMNLSIVQFGSVLFFLLMVGYHYYLQKKDTLSGIFWGCIIALKLFPALLFFYLLKQKRYRVFLVTLTTFLLASLISLLIYNPAIYQNYFSMMRKVSWYGDNWNASIFGFIFRLTTNFAGPYLLLFCILLFLYFKAMGPKEIKGETNHQPFCLTLTMMVLLSPFGWIYYFQLLIPALLFTGVLAFQKKNYPFLVAWTLCFFLLDYPQGYIMAKQMQNFSEKISLYSLYFYGLVLLNILVILRQKMPGNNQLNINAIMKDEKKNRILLALKIILAFALIVSLQNFLTRIGSSENYNLKALNRLMGEN